MARKTLGRPLNREDLKLAARLYYKERWAWGRIAKHLKCVPMTLYNHRHGLTGAPGEWVEVLAEVVEEMRAEAPATAWGGLVRSARSGDTAASRELLARTEGAVTQEVKVRGGLDLTLYGDLSESARDEIRAVAEGRVFGETDDGSADTPA